MRSQLWSHCVLLLWGCAVKDAYAEDLSYLLYLNPMQSPTGFVYRHHAWDNYQAYHCVNGIVWEAVC